MGGQQRIDLELGDWLEKQIKKNENARASGEANIYEGNQLLGESKAYQAALKKLRALQKRPVTRGG